MMTKFKPVFSERRQQLIMWMLLSLMPIVGMAVDLILPALPIIFPQMAIL